MPLHLMLAALFGWLERERRFLRPLPLLVALVAALVAGEVERLVLVAGALASCWGGGALAVRGFVNEARYLLGKLAGPPRRVFIQVR